MEPTQKTSASDIFSKELQKAWKRLCISRKLLNIINNHFNVKERYELRNIVERYLISSFPTIQFKENRKACIAFQEELKLKKLNNTYYNKFQTETEKEDENIDFMLTDIISLLETKEDTQNDIIRFVLNQKEIKLLQSKFGPNIYPYLLFSIEIEKQMYNDFQRNGATFINIITSLFYFHSLLPGSQQWAIPSKEYENLINKYEITVEGFASPFTSQIRKYNFINNFSFKYCSIYPGDKLLGSLGNFFDLEFCGECVIINPPFIEEILIKTVNKCIEELDKYPCKFLFNGPNWEDSIFYEKLTKSKFLKEMTIRDKFNHSYEDINGKSIQARFQTIVCLLERS